MKDRRDKGKVLVIDDEERIRTILAAVLTDEGYTVQTAKDGIDALDITGRFEPQVVIVDLQMPRVDGLETIARFKERFPGTPAIILTAHGSIQSAVQAIKQGAYDYLTKPFDNDQMLLVVKRAMDLFRLSTEVHTLKGQVMGARGVKHILGKSIPMERLREEISRVAQTDATVLIEGESGTGKELAARAIHYESNRKDCPLVIVDCAAIPSSLIESEFFGHEKGAFTDAQESRTGRFEQADTGTIFLDEIGELPLEAQTRLLRVLQEREVSRVGSNSPLKVDVRVIAATNKDLQAEVGTGRFREDLFYRLNVLKLRIPSLREHREDIPLLVDHFVTKHRDTFRRAVNGASDETLRLLSAADWRGNIRELENVVQRALMNSQGAQIEASDIDFRQKSNVKGSHGYKDGQGLEDFVTSLVEHTEREIILETLRQAHWSRTDAAQRLKVSRKTLFNKMQQYRLGEEENE